MNVQAIKAAIEQLTESERRELADWLEQLEEEAWDAEMEQDFAPGGRGRRVLERINQEIDEDKFTPMEKGLHSRQEQKGMIAHGLKGVGPYDVVVLRPREDVEA